MDNREKLEAIKAFLTENNLEFEENHLSKSLKINIDLVVKPYRIAVHLSDDYDKRFFKLTKRTYHPFFIRDNETVEFVLEKMQNCIISEMTNVQKNINGKREAAENKKRQEARIMEQMTKKRQRVRIPRAERVTPINK